MAGYNFRKRICNTSKESLGPWRGCTCVWEEISGVGRSRKQNDVDIPGQKFEHPSAISRGRVSPRAGGRVRGRVCAGGRGRVRRREYIQHSKTGCKRRSKQGRCNKGMQQNAASVAITGCPLDIESCGKHKATESKGFACAYSCVRDTTKTSNAKPYPE